MYNQQQGYNNSAVYGGGYGMDCQQQYYQQQQQSAQQQRVAGVMGYYSPEVAAMFYNPYAYGAHQQHPAQPTFNQRLPQPMDYQLTPALYLLNQQAELLQRSLQRSIGPQQSSRTVKKSASTAAPRKPRGPYKRRANKSLSPSTSPAPEQDNDSDRFSSSDLSGSNNRSTNSIQSVQDQQQQQQQQPAERKRKSDSFAELEQQQTKKQSIEQAPSSVPPTSGVLRQRRQSIFYSVALMAESSCNNQR